MECYRLRRGRGHFTVTSKIVRKRQSLPNSPVGAGWPLWLDTSLCRDVMWGKMKADAHKHFCVLFLLWNFNFDFVSLQYKFRDTFKRNFFLCLQRANSRVDEKFIKMILKGDLYQFLYSAFL